MRADQTTADIQRQRQIERIDHALTMINLLKRSEPNNPHFWPRRSKRRTRSKRKATK